MRFGPVKEVETKGVGKRKSLGGSNEKKRLKIREKDMWWWADKKLKTRIKGMKWIKKKNKKWKIEENKTGKKIDLELTVVPRYSKRKHLNIILWIILVSLFLWCHKPHAIISTCSNERLVFPTVMAPLLLVVGLMCHAVSKNYCLSCFVSCRPRHSVGDWQISSLVSCCYQKICKCVSPPWPSPADLSFHRSRPRWRRRPSPTPWRQVGSLTLHPSMPASTSAPSTTQHTSASSLLHRQTKCSRPVPLPLFFLSLSLCKCNHGKFFFFIPMENWDEFQKITKRKLSSGYESYVSYVQHIYKVLHRKARQQQSCWVQRCCPCDY